MSLLCTNYRLVLLKMFMRNKKSKCNVRKWDLWSLFGLVFGVFLRFNEKHKLNEIQSKAKQVINCCQHLSFIKKK